MHRFLLALCALALLASTACAADPRFGLEAGGSMVWLDQDTAAADSLDSRSRFDVNAAATLHFDLSRVWGLTTGLRYSRLGDEVRYPGIRTATDPTGESTAGTLTIRQVYLGVPVLLRWNFLGRRGAFLCGGAEVAWLSYAKSELVYDAPVTAPVNPEGERDITDRLNRYNLTAIIGAGLELDIGSHRIEFMVRYGQGLVDTVKDVDDREYAERRTREAALTVGWRM